MTPPEILGRMADAVSAVKQLADSLAATFPALRADYELLPLRDPVVGAGRYNYNADMLTNENMAEIESAVHRGDLVQVCLYADRWQAGYRIARVTEMVGEKVVCVMWGDNENDLTRKITLDLPRKRIWGWYIAPKVSSV